MDNLRGFLGIRRMDRVPNARMKQLCRDKNGVSERILRWFGHVEKIENDMIAKKDYVGECVLVVVRWVRHRRDGLIP